MKKEKAEKIILAVLVCVLIIVAAIVFAPKRATEPVPPAPSANQPS